MNFLNSNELYAISKHEKMKSLWAFIESEESNFINNADKAEIQKWMKQANAQQHNEGNFFSKLKEIFTEDGVCYVKEGQEDSAAISLNNSVVIVRHSDFGLAFNIIQNDSNDINPENWMNFQRILGGLKLGFINPKDFHSMKIFDNISNELENKDSVKERKVKI
jgi:hypothetical protein